MTHRSAFFRVALVLAGVFAHFNLPGQNSHSSPFEPSVATHETRADSEAVLQFSNQHEMTVEPDGDVAAPATRSSFMAKWERVSGANGYLLDVSTSDSFDSYVEGYHDLDVGDVTGRVVTVLER